MKLVRKTVLLILVLIMAIGLVNVSAKTTLGNDSQVQYHLSEYEFYVSVRKMQFSEAESKFGISRCEYETICNIEQEIVELSALENDELESRGLDSKQINLLKDYDGSRLEENPQLKGVLATLSVTLSIVSSSSSAVSVKANWAWNSKPLVTSIDFFETVAFRWKAYNSAGAQITASYNSSNSYCYATYYYGSSSQTTQLKSISVGNTTSFVYSQYSTSIIYGGNNCWAKKGYMLVRVTGSNFSKVDFGFGYNHGVSSTPATVTLDGNLGFNYSNGYEMSEQSISANI